ncbi:hypothetical protein M231_00334 [Tremella mesenterica]|uniref:Chromosome transmission fidelity protein 8 n=1 Tax=Tremella mesenterica TaxID=5217 RepID=A0A4Q1BW09_TREME|nr:hypothetical protein M231_00334 [Tremella mesenterica]
MRIHLPLSPDLLKPTVIDPESPLVKLGGEVVLIELQGELSWEGDKSDGVVGVLGLDRPDKPTLHLGPHHLLHGKIVSLPKPLAVIRKSHAPIATTHKADVHSDRNTRGVLEGDVSEEDQEEEEHDPLQTMDTRAGPSKPSKVKKTTEESEEEDEEPLFPMTKPFRTPSRLGKSHGHTPSIKSSSPVYPPSSIQDYSSDLDPTSPYRQDECDRQMTTLHDNEDEMESPSVLRREREKRKREEEEKKRRKKRKLEHDKERTRYYEVVGLVRKKVVFSLRPEPIVTATVLPD